ncbi:hypothetical protein BH23CHL2_BH23CHL2_20810 [soil metagenome]
MLLIINRLRSVTALALALSLLIVAGGTKDFGQRDPEVRAQDAAQQPEDVFNVPAVVVADPDSGIVQTYDLEGTPNSAVPNQNFAPGDKVAFGDFSGHALPERNQNCILIARAEVGDLDFCRNFETAFTFLGSGFTDGDGLAVGEASSQSGFDEVLIARADSDVVDIYAFADDPVVGMEVVASFDAEFDPGDTLIASNEFVSLFPGFGDIMDVFIVDHEDSKVRMFRQSETDETDFFAAGSFDIPPSTDAVAIGNMDPFGDPTIVTANADDGVVTVFDYSPGRDPSLRQITTFDSPFSTGDSLILADVHAKTYDSILIGDAATGLVNVYSLTFDPDAPISEAQQIDLNIPVNAELDASDLFLTDVDGDGLFDVWEIAGVDTAGSGQINIDLPAMGADPLHKDLFVEYDYVSGREPHADSIEMVKEAFAFAPPDAGGIVNPDLLPGINLWVDTGGLTDDGNIVGDDFGNESPVIPSSTNICGLDDAFYAAKKQHFDPLRALVFHYAISGQSGCGTGGRGEVGGNDFIVHINANDMLGSFPTDEEIHIALATEGGTFMHELGHNLNLSHGGPPLSDEDYCKPNHVSVMNYDHPFIERTNGTRILDFSPPRHPDGRGHAPLDPLFEDSLDENDILDRTDHFNQFVFTSPDDPADTSSLKILHPLNETVDWDQDPNTTEEDLQINVNTSGRDEDGNSVSSACENALDDEVLTGHHDWDAISVAFQQFGNAADGPINPTTDPEPTAEEILALQSALHTADLTITKSAPVDEIAAGEQLDYTINVTNEGPNPAAAVEVIDTLPDGFSYLSGDASCSSSGGDVVCELGYMLPGDSQEITITVQVDPALVFDAGGPVTVTNAAEVVETGFGDDPNPNNNEAEIDTNVVAEADLEAVSLTPPDDPVEVILDQPTNVLVDKTVANHGPSGPIDVALGVDGTPDDAVEISLAAPATLPALGLDEERQITATLEVLCTEPGLQNLTVTSSVSPLNDEDTDPDTSNNEASVDLAVECVTPVAIDIEPGSDENPINLKGNAPVAVLTTEAGELDLPAAFDATTIDPLSVLFGSRDTLFGATSPTGAGEFHDRGHPEDVDSDGDTDVMLHFRVPESGLEQGDTEACVRGEYTKADGGTAVFFGCDDIRTVP